MVTGSPSCEVGVLVLKKGGVCLLTYAVLGRQLGSEPLRVAAENAAMKFPRVFAVGDQDIIIHWGVPQPGEQLA